MGSTSSANIDPTLLEEAAMYSSSTIKECIQYYNIFSNTCRIESMNDNHFDRKSSSRSLAVDSESTAHDLDDIQTMGDDGDIPKRIDPYNGTAYTREEFMGEYAGTAEWDAAKEVAKEGATTANMTTDTTDASSSSFNSSRSSPTPTMRYEEFLCIPEFTYHPLAQQLFEWALHTEPYFEHETRLPFTKFAVLLAVLAQNGSVHTKTKLAYYLIAGKSTITRSKLKQYLVKIANHMSEDILNHATEQIFTEVKESGGGSAKSNPGTIDLNEYMRSVSVADDFASKIFVEFKCWSVKQLIKKRKHRNMRLIEEKEKEERLMIEEMEIVDTEEEELKLREEMKKSGALKEEEEETEEYLSLDDLADLKRDGAIRSI